MCGIFGFISVEPSSPEVVLEGLRFLEYRGYDSWGIAVASDSRVVLDKATGPISNATTSLPFAHAALGHTRWATHGSVTHANAHPHSDCEERFGLIHNGIVENYQDLAGRLRPGHVFRSQTDTEVLVHLLEEEIQREPDLMRALLTVFRQVEGLSAVAVLDALTNQIVVAKNGSPVAIGWGDRGMYVASDPSALLGHTRRMTFMEDGQAASLSSDGATVYDVATGKPLDALIREITWDTHRAGLDGFSHFMAKEIHEQPAVLRHVAEAKGDDASALAELISNARDVYLIGCGSAHHAAMSGRYLLAELAGVNAVTAPASEMSLIEPLLKQDSLVVAFSQSGETLDVLEAVRAARARGAMCAALVNGEGSTLDRFADLSVLLECGVERCVLATKTYTAMVAIMHLTARTLAGEPALGAMDLREADVRVESLLARETVHGLLKATARRIVDHQHLFVLGRHRNFPLALEAALKIKEVSYLHAEGFAAGELKHGVIALVTSGTPCLILAPDAEYRREALAAAAEVRARGALTIGFSPVQEAEFDVTIPVAGGQSSPFEIAAASQLLGYELALLLGCDPDKPRNLAKSVTVK